MNRNNLLRALLAASAIGASPAAMAAQAPAQDETRDASRPEPAGSAGTANDQLIIVTAQKRAENMQDVPASISVVGGEDLVRSGAAQISDFAGYVPGLHGENRGTPGGSRVALRGIPPLGANATVGIYIDD